MTDVTATADRPARRSPAQVIDSCWAPCRRSGPGRRGAAERPPRRARCRRSANLLNAARGRPGCRDKILTAAGTGNLGLLASRPHRHSRRRRAADGRAPAHPQPRPDRWPELRCCRPCPSPTWPPGRRPDLAGRRGGLLGGLLGTITSLLGPLSSDGESIAGPLLNLLPKTSPGAVGELLEGLPDGSGRRPRRAAGHPARRRACGPGRPPEPAARAASRPPPSSS